MTDTKTVDEIVSEIKDFPEDYLEELLDFVHYLKRKAKNNGDIDLAAASESSLRKDWDRPEEDEAWQEL